VRFNAVLFGQNVNDGKLWLLNSCIVFEPRPVRVIKRTDIQLYKVNRSGACPVTDALALTAVQR
jgi:hypothetical protein